MTAPSANDEKSIFVFLTKAVCAFIAIPFAMYFIFPGAAHLCLNDKNFSFVLMVLNSWTVLGVLICTFILAPEHQKNHKQLWLVFFVPTIGLYLTAPLYCSLKFSIDRAFSSVTSQLANTPKYYMLDDGTVAKTDPAAQERSDTKTEVRSAPAIFYARYPIKAGESFNAKNLKVLSAEAEEAENSVIANQENYFGESGSVNSMLLRKAKRALKAGQTIKNSDIEPPYESRFVLHRK